MKAIVTAVRVEHQFLYFVYDVYDDTETKIDSSEMQFTLTVGQTIQQIIDIVTIVLQNVLVQYEAKDDADIGAITASVVGLVVYA